MKRKKKKRNNFILIKMAKQRKASCYNKFVKEFIKTNTKCKKQGGIKEAAKEWNKIKKCLKKK
jgi:hypothetical protein